MKATSVQDAFEKICATEAPLHERMAAFSEAVREFGLPFAEAYDDLVARIRSGEAGSTAPEPGELMPGFLLPASSGRLVSLEDVIAEGPAVISFNRGHWCEYCRIELTAFRQGMSEIAAHGARVVSIMPESEVFTGKAAAEAGNALEILSHIDNGYALTMGLASGSATACATSTFRTASTSSASRTRRTGSCRSQRPSLSAATP